MLDVVATLTTELAQTDPFRFVKDENCGRVVLATHRDGRGPFAIKLLSKTNIGGALAARVREEVETMRRLPAHPNVVALRDAFVTPEFVALVLDYCAGGNLGALLAKENGRFEASVAWHFAKQLADGLQFLHQHHVIHRDLKPENLLLSDCTAFAQLRVADFGFARSLEESTQLLTSVLGTPYYMAPELLARKQYDYRSDLWSFGAILYEMLVGRRAWPGVGSFEALQQAHARPVSFPKGLAVSPLAHKLLVERLLIVDVAARVTPTDFFADAYFSEYARVSVARIEKNRLPPAPPTDFIVVPNDAEESVRELACLCAAKFALAVSNVCLFAGPGTGETGDVVLLEPERSIGFYRLLERQRPVYVVESEPTATTPAAVFETIRASLLVAPNVPSAEAVAIDTSMPASTVQQGAPQVPASAAQTPASATQVPATLQVPATASQIPAHAPVPASSLVNATTTTAFVSQYDPPDVLLPSALPLSEFLVSSARDTFEAAANGRDELGAPDLASLLAFLSIPSAYASHFAPNGTNKGVVTFDAFLRGLVSIRDHSNGALMETMGAVSAPLHLLTVDAERKLQVNEAALQELRQYNCSLKIVGVLGAYRTGKSYLLNLLFDRPDGFKLGSTVKGETRGVWIAVRRSTVPGAPAIALLDTEGLSDVENPDEDYDLRIMTITLLLSSLLLVNVKGTIDSATFKQLGFVTRLSKSIKCKANESSDEAGGEFAQIFPHLLFVVRDTMLKIGESNEAFLERVLAPLPKATSIQARQANEVRDMLRVWFPLRRLWRLVKPRFSENELQHMERFSLGDTRLEFAASMAALKAHLLGETPAKRIAGSDVTGPQLASLVCMLVDGVNSGVGVNVKDAWQAMNVEQCNAAIDEALALYNENMAVESVMFPIEVDCLVALSGENVERAATIYNDKAPDCAAKVELLERLHARLDLAAREFLDRNERTSTELCERVEKEIVDSLRTLLDNYVSFCEAHDAGLARFEADSIGPAAPRVKERLLERVHLLQQTASMKARLDDAQQKAIELEHKMRMQNAMQEKLAADLMNERATREEQMQTHNAEILNLTAATEAQVDGIRRDADERIARVQAEWEAATRERNTAAAAAAEAEIKAAREEAAAAERRLKADMDERIKKLNAQRVEQQAAMEALVARINKLQQASASSAANTKKNARKASGAPLCRGITAEGCACQRKSWSESGYCHDHEHQAKSCRSQAKKK